MAGKRQKVGEKKIKGRKKERGKEKNRKGLRERHLKYRKKQQRPDKPQKVTYTEGRTKRESRLECNFRGKYCKKKVIDC